ncbi:(4Fe-4S)-binding protein [Pareuzebyella sediminis]|uniref:(4Fe-4S)-binding protein n=2 Tax=Pareuzebyella sediminis TaxID=2607998 RepID=UPI0011EBDF3F|nr:(4Fe-4S)-binding protein [Pareuzebyella sediminis]
MKKVKEYSNEEITILWKPEKCIHSGICVRLLPEVYNPKERPWVKIENASTEALKAQVANCPSRALSLKDKTTSEHSTTGGVTKISITENGPLLITGNLEIKKVDGTIDKKNKVSALCRCGGSNNKPYCDGSHAKIGFKD